LHQVGYLLELYRDARSPENIYIKKRQIYLHLTLNEWVWVHPPVTGESQSSMTRSQKRARMRINTYMYTYVYIRV